MKPSWNDRFFDVWSESMAYVLGLIWADGCLNGPPWHSYISFGQKDKDLLESVADAIGTPRFRIKEGRTNADRVVYRLTFTSKRAIKRLVEIGLKPRKSKILRFPEVPEEWIRHFVRGYFDGDGTISTRVEKGRKHLRSTVEFYGTREFLTSFSEKICSGVGLKRGPKYYRGSVWRLRFAAKYDVLDIRDWMYKDSTIYLLRKKERFDLLAA